MACVTYLLTNLVAHMVHGVLCCMLHLLRSLLITESRNTEGTVQNPEPSAKFLCAVPRFSKPGSATRTFALRSFCAAQKATRSILILSWEWRCWTKLVSRPSDSRPLACAAALAGSVPRCRPQRRSNRRSSRSCNGVASFLLKALKV